MHIDFERLKARRDMDPFACPPIEISEALALTAGVLRDSSLANPEIMAAEGTALSRVVATDVTPRMRQLLAILAWTPLDPASDDRWILDEPVGLPAHVNASVAELTARHYAEGMSLLFSPDDGMFEGSGWRFGEDGDRSAKALLARVKTMAERRWVAVSLAMRFCPATVLLHWIGRDVERIDPARLRCDLAALSCPSMTTVQRWCREFGETHARRPGLASEWRNHRP